MTIQPSVGLSCRCKLLFICDFFFWTNVQNTNLTTSISTRKTLIVCTSKNRVVLYFETSNNLQLFLCFLIIFFWGGGNCFQLPVTFIFYRILFSHIHKMCLYSYLQYVNDLIICVHSKMCFSIHTYTRIFRVLS